MLNVQLNIENCALNIPWKHEERAYKRFVLWGLAPFFLAPVPV